MSFLLDTNIISEFRRGRDCDRKVMEWHQNHVAEGFYLSVLTTGEIRKGIESCRARQPSKAHALETWLRGIEAAFERRILPVTAEIADLWGRKFPDASVSVVDSLLAATAGHYGYTVATRNVRDFQRCGVDFVNPFEA